VGEIVWAGLNPAPETPLNVPIGPHRRYAVVRCQLSEFKEVKDALGGTVNDVVLAAATGGLRRLLLHRGERPPAAGLRAMVPVNLRAAADEGDLGNRITSLFVDLPVAEAQPFLRYEKVVEATRALKSGTEGEGATTLIGLTALAPPVLHATIARSLYATRLFNVTITNVPGPQRTLYAFGAPLREVIPLVPLAAEHAVGIAIVSYDGGVVFGLNADHETVADLHALREGIESSLAELQALVNSGAAASS
jgi:WS/DGAT/MGAT family acyltransferase